MSYRTFKHLLGETSLERKCRFIFGGGILALVTLSFYLYGQKTESLVIAQSQQAARMQIKPLLESIHTRSFMRPEVAPIVDDLSRELNPHDGFQSLDSHVMVPYSKDPEKKPRDEDEAQTLDRFLRAARRQNSSAPALARKPYTFPDGTPTEFSAFPAGKNQYQYYQAVLYKPGCLTSDCHDLRFNHMSRPEADGKFVLSKAGDLAGVVVVKLPLEQTKQAIHRNRAILIATALVTAILAMFASWTIVRYVIVRPVKHLRDVSNAIAAGKLTIRSQIQTGDEFEELSHAFNRMLHNLVAMQQELRDVNADLDRKVDELAQANMALFEMNRLKSDFLATMSHELRTPLNSIIGFSEVLAGNEALHEKQRRYAGNILTSGKMLLAMINDILDLAKIESGKMDVQPEDFSVRDVCEALAAMMRGQAEKKGIELECRLEEAIPLVRQDPSKLKQILYNLLSNAIKFTPEGGRVTLSARAEGRNVVLAVADTGVGIAPEDRDTIFEKFRQARQPGVNGDVLTREHQGTGLGLSIVRELCKLLGGSIELESEPGRGSTFTVTIPQQLAASKRFEVSVSDQTVDLTKARKVEVNPGLPLPGPLSRSPLVPGQSPAGAAGSGLVGPRPAPSGPVPRRPGGDPLLGRDGIRLDRGQPRR